MMNVGTKSLLFGVHQLVLHPYAVLRAWIELYGWPTWRELVCIIIHDWGYWGKPNMDGKEGESHPLLGANIGGRLFGHKYWLLCAHHSRHWSKLNGESPSKLCWADKLSIKYMPTWLYLLLGTLSGEIKEYRRKSAINFSIFKSNREWHEWMKAGMIRMAEQRDAGAMPYMQKE